MSNKRTRLGGIYCIKNLINGKVYVGRATDLVSRFFRHKRELQEERHHNIHLQRAWDKYGIENFEFEILEYVTASLENKEIEWIDRLDAFHPECGYNITKGGSGSIGMKHTKKSKEKMKEWHKGKILTEEHKKKIGVGSRRAGCKPPRHSIEKLREFARSRAKLDEFQVRDIKWLLKFDINQSQIARMFGVSPSTIYDIKQGRIYNYI